MTIVRDQKNAGGASVEAIFAWVFTLLSFGYFLPWAIAATRRKSNSISIMLLNLFLGWTVIGWIIALVMACSAHQVAVIAPVPVVVTNQLGGYQPPPALPATETLALPAAAAQPLAAAGWYPQADGTQRYWDGAAWTEHITAQPEQA
jgi:hypothetical protein